MCALVIYSNGIFEEHLSEGDVFEENELVNSFDDYAEIKTHRLAEIPNCWMVWAEMPDPPENEYNKFASEIMDEDIFSHLIFLHDSEINPDWKLTDDILYKPYAEFIKQVGQYIKDLMNYIINETEKEYEEEGTTSMIFIRALGYTADKRVLYVFNPEEQQDDFYRNGWDHFSEKIYAYLKSNFEKEIPEPNKPLVIFADTKIIVLVEDEHVNKVIENLLQHFQNKEDYEACSFISNVREEWYQRKTIPANITDTSTGKRRRGRPRKNKDNNEKAD